jgi:hypothetical protein
MASPKSSPKERTLTALFFRILSLGEGRVRQKRCYKELKYTITIKNEGLH